MFWLGFGFVCVVVWGGLCCFVGFLVFPFFAFRMHKVVIHSKTVTIVMMSAAQEQKKKFCLEFIPDCLTGLKLSFVVSTTFIPSLRRLR